MDLVFKCLYHDQDDLTCCNKGSMCLNPINHMTLLDFTTRFIVIQSPLGRQISFYDALTSPIIRFDAMEFNPIYTMCFHKVLFGLMSLHLKRVLPARGV